MDNYMKDNPSDSHTDVDSNDKTGQSPVPQHWINSDETQENFTNDDKRRSANFQEIIISLKISRRMGSEVEPNNIEIAIQNKDILEDQKNKPEHLKWIKSPQEILKKGAHRIPSKMNGVGLMLIYIIVCAIQVQTIQCIDDVSWKVNTSPIVFGETLELKCKISNPKNKCDIHLRTWYGSKDDVLLCQNGKCKNETKYTERKNDDCSFSLVIADLSISDIDVYYTCSYGVSESKKVLLKTDFDFI
ncbi:Hypothetical predicted protein, partial [Mytilus galloprovincialis]